MSPTLGILLPSVAVASDGTTPHAGKASANAANHLAGSMASSPLLLQGLGGSGSLRLVSWCDSKTKRCHPGPRARREEEATANSAMGKKRKRTHRSPPRRQAVALRWQHEFFHRIPHPSPWPVLHPSRGHRPPVREGQAS